MFKKYKLLIITMLTVLCLGASSFLGGCNLREPSNEEADMAAVIEKINFDADENFEGELSVWIQQKTTETKIINKFIESFNLKYPKITVTVKAYVEDIYIATLRNKHAGAHTTGNFSEMPDVFWLANESIPSLKEMEILAPINYIDQADKNFSTDNLVDLMVKDSMYGDNLYMMPRDYNQFTLFYNKWFFDAYKDELAEAGLGIPDSTTAMDAQTFEAYLSEFNNLMKYRSKTPPSGSAGASFSRGLSLDADFSWPSLSYGTFRSFGSYVADSSGKIIFDSEQTFSAVDWVKRGAANGWVSLPGDVASGSSFKAFTSPFLIESRAVFSDLLDNSPGTVKGMNDYIGVLPMPQLDSVNGNYAIGAGCSGYSMYYNPNHPTEAWLFLKHMVSVEGQNAFGETGNSVPVLESLLSDPDAAWRNLDDYGISLIAGFNHDAFIYKYNTASCTMVDFKSVLPPKSVGSVITTMAATMKRGVKSTPPVTTDYAPKVKAEITSMANSIKSTVDAYR